MQWSHYKDGLLARSSEGYFFLFNRFDTELGAKRWFAKYEPGIHFFADKGALIGKRHGYITLAEAKFEAEQTAKMANNAS
jgi:hypothetical protein